MSLARFPLPVERSLAAGSFLLAALLTTALFVPTMGSYLAVLDVDSVDADVASATVEGDELRLSLAVTNPTGRPIEVFAGRLQARDGDAFLTTIAGTEVADVTVPAGETATVDVALEIREGRRDRLVSAMEGDGVTVAGVLRGTIAESTVEIEVGAAGVTLDG